MVHSLRDSQRKDWAQQRKDWALWLTLKKINKNMQLNLGLYKAGYLKKVEGMYYYT